MFERPHLHAMAGAGDVQALVRLIGLGADVSGTDLIGDAPLHNAAMRGHLEACRVLVEIDRLDGDLGGEVVLAARWTVTAEPGSAGDAPPARRRAAHCRQPASGPGYDAYVQAIGAAVAQLGQELAASLSEP